MPRISAGSSDRPSAWKVGESANRIGDVLQPARPSRARGQLDRAAHHRAVDVGQLGLAMWRLRRKRCSSAGLPMLPCAPLSTTTET
jgi:hypothetical protein